MEELMQYRALLAVDVERSAGRGNVAFHRVREVLGHVVREAVACAGIDWTACVRTDLGDGVRLAFPSGAPKARLIHPLAREVAVRLRSHNRTAGEPTRIRVRMALHAGDVLVSPDGAVTGRPLEELARLLDADAVRSALSAAPRTTTAALVVSPHVHDETVRHGYPGIDPESFRRVRVTNKEYDSDAWLHFPDAPQTQDASPEIRGASPAGDGPAPRAETNSPAGGGTPAAAGEGGRMIVHAHDESTVNAVQYGTLHIRNGGRGKSGD